ncbi:MAG: O-antigen ligase family protein [Halanaerobiales bacterium]|nr:O-antigen ligase family protein [Halanaerobiales bacterium]
MNLKSQNYEKLISLILIVIVTVTPLLYFPYFEKGEPYRIDFDKTVLLRYDNIYKPKIYTTYYLVVLLVIILGLKIRYKKKSIKPDINNISVTLFFLFTILSTFFSNHFFRSIYGKPFRWEGLITYISYVLIFITAGYFIAKRKFLKSIIKYLFISASILSVYGLLQFYGLDFIKRGPIRENWQRAFATFGNPNFAASYVAIVLSLSLVLYIYNGNKIRMYIYGLISSLFFAFLIATSTRSALVGFFVSTIIFIAFFYRFLRNNIKKVLIITLIFIIIFFILDSDQQYYYSDRIFEMFRDVKTITVSEEQNAIERAGTLRFVLYKYSIPLLFEKPILGSGPDTFDYRFPHREYNKLMQDGSLYLVDKAHNEYLQIGITLGLPALLFYLLLLANIYKNGFKALKRLKNQVSELNIYHTALFMAVITYTVTALFNISVVSVAPIFWAVLGLNVAVYRMREQSENNI